MYRSKGGILSNRLAIARCLAWLGVAALAVAVCVSAATAATDKTKPKAKPKTFAAPLVVKTDKGSVRGVARNGMRLFLGIPYAAPPVGNLRWRPPQDAASWTGVKATTAFAPHCPQPGTPYGVPSTNEDCLNLNVFTPRTLTRGKKYPVMFWIHGGALVVGESDDYDPARLVAKGVIVVTINYRLGLLGFLAHPTLTAESGASGDFGWLDQQAALRWVQTNIAAFAGNAANVTVFGESAGAFSTHAQLASPLARGLFAKAIVESGAYALTNPTLAVAEAAGQAAAARMGCADQSLACLRAAPASAVVAANTQASIVPPVENKVLTQSIGAAFTSGNFNRVPVIEGSNKDEWRLFVAQAEATTRTPLTEAAYVQAIAATLSIPVTVAQAIAAAYPVSVYGGNPSVALGAIGTDAVFACPARRAVRSLSAFTPTYQYEFADPDAPMRFFSGISFPTGAYHASELQYLFITSNAPVQGTLNGSQQQLSNTMVTYWTQFAKTSNPNAGGAPNWPRFDASTEQYQALVPPAPSTVSGFNFQHNCSTVWGG
jgi:para-nitrobenzyl esterase